MTCKQTEVFTYSKQNILHTVIKIGKLNRQSSLRRQSEEMVQLTVIIGKIIHYDCNISHGTDIYCRLVYKS